MNQVYWTESARTIFLQESGLMWRSELGSQKARELIMTLKKHIADKTNAEISEELHLAESRIDEYIRELKNIYDDIVYYTMKLIPRMNLTKKDEEVQLSRYGFILNAENLKKYRGFDR